METQSDFKIINTWMCPVENGKINPCFGDIAIHGGKIKSCHVRPFPEFISGGDDPDILDAGGRVLTLPLVNFHEHIYSRLAKGISVRDPMNNFIQILENLWWKLDRSLDPDIIKVCAEVAVQEFIKNGVTYIFDHHSSPGSIKGSLSIISDVLKRHHLRGVLCYETSDRNDQSGIQQSLQENYNFISSKSCEDIKGMLGLHACFTLSDNTLSRVQKIVQEQSAPIHIHLAEDQADVDYCRKTFGLSPVQRLLKYDLLKPAAHLVHGVHLTREDYETIANAKAAIITNPDSNMNNAVGLPNYASIPLEIPLLIGTDGMHANIHRSLKQLFLLYRIQKNGFDESFNWLQKIHTDQIETIRNWFPDFPALREGDRADFVVWDYIPITPFNQGNYFGHLIYGLTESRAHTVVQNGHILMREYKITNDQNISFQIQQGKKLYNRMEDT